MLSLLIEILPQALQHLLDVLLFLVFVSSVHHVLHDITLTTQKTPCAQNISIWFWSTSPDAP